MVSHARAPAHGAGSGCILCMAACAARLGKRPLPGLAGCAGLPVSERWHVLRWLAGTHACTHRWIYMVIRCLLYNICDVHRPHTWPSIGLLSTINIVHCCLLHWEPAGPCLHAVSQRLTSRTTVHPHIVHCACALTCCSSQSLKCCCLCEYVVCWHGASRHQFCYYGRGCLLCSSAGLCCAGCQHQQDLRR